jgi:hypothetical protein
MSTVVSFTASQAVVHLRLLLHLGDLSVVLPAAVAIGAWLLAARAWRLAFWWSLLFGLGVSLVGASKIAFMGWGGGLPDLAFKSFSGHATGSMAVFPMLFYLVMQSASPRLGKLGAGAGVLLGLSVALLLVVFGEHSASEALAGCALGAMASLGSMHLAGAPLQTGLHERLHDHLQPGHPPQLGQGHHLRRLREARSVLIAALIFCLLAWLMKSAHFGYWMIKAARALSGNHHLYPLSTD